MSYFGPWLPVLVAATRLIKGGSWLEPGGRAAWLSVGVVIWGTGPSGHLFCSNLWSLIRARVGDSSLGPVSMSLWDCWQNTPLLQAFVSSSVYPSGWITLWLHVRNLELRLRFGCGSAVWCQAGCTRITWGSNSSILFLGLFPTLPWVRPQNLYF